jgi:hypothetical protein
MSGPRPFLQARELDRVRDQIVEDLREPRPVTNELRRPVGIERELDVVLCRHRARRLDCFPHHLVEICQPGLEGDLARVHLRGEEQIVDHAQQPARIAVHDRQVPELLFRQLSHVTVQHELEIAANRGERRAQLMGHRGDEVVLQLIEAPELLVLCTEPSHHADRADRDVTAAGDRQHRGRDCRALLAQDRESERGDDRHHRGDARHRNPPLVRVFHVRS